MLNKIHNEYQEFEVFNLFAMDGDMFWYDYDKRKGIEKSFVNSIGIKHNFYITLDYENNFAGFKILSKHFSKKDIKRLFFLKEYVNGKTFNNKFVRSLCAKKLRNEVNVWYK